MVHKIIAGIELMLGGGDRFIWSIRKPDVRRRWAIATREYGFSTYVLFAVRMLSVEGLGMDRRIE